MILGTGEHVSEKEIRILENLLVPGFKRHLMPAVPEKTQEIRRAEKAEIYPFSTMAIEELERGLMLLAMQDMMKAKEPDHDWKFLNRSYEERMQPSVLKQVLSKSLSFEVDNTTAYYAQEDALLLAIYNRTPHNRVIKRQWTAPYNVVPDFSNWLQHFPADYVPTSALLDIDDLKVGLLREKLKLLLPSDSSVINVSKWEVAGQTHSKVSVNKDNYTFGLTSHVVAGDGEEIENLQGPADFWVNFENGARMLVEMQEQSTFRVEKDKRATPVPQDGGEGEGTSPRNQEDSPGKESMDGTQPFEISNEGGASATITFSDNLLIKFLPNGDVLQSRSDHVN